MIKGTSGAGGVKSEAAPRFALVLRCLCHKREAEDLLSIPQFDYDS